MRNKFLISAECIIRDSNQKILTIIRPNHKHAGGLISFPGGGCEVVDGDGSNDCLKNTAIREVQEEVGIVLEDELKYLFSSMFKDSVNNNKVVHVVFLCDIINTNINLQVDGVEVTEHFWLTKDEILRYKNCPPWVHDYIQLL